MEQTCLPLPACANARFPDDAAEASSDRVNTSQKYSGLAWNALSLCRRYLMVVFTDQTVSVLEAGAVRGHRVLWALGILVDGEYELLGAWGEPDGKEVVADLAHRGVEKIRFVSGGESRELHASVFATYPGATALPEAWRLGIPSALPPRYRGVARTSADAIEQLRLRANRRVSRHGSFSCLAEATPVVMNALKRAELSIQLAVACGAPGPKSRTALDSRSY